MKVLMLGWEFPPHISGGLGTACEGLSQGLARAGVNITFVVPHLYGGENAPHMNLTNALRQTLGELEEIVSDLPPQAGAQTKGLVQRTQIPSLLQPYLSPENFAEYLDTLTEQGFGDLLSHDVAVDQEIEQFIDASLVRRSGGGTVQRYGWDIFSEVSRFASQVCAHFKNEAFDLIHCHDWMTFPAGIALSRASGKPFIAHVHSLEVDRSGSFPNQQIHEIERWGLHEAGAAVAVSHYTKDLIHRVLGVPSRKITVVHNGVYSEKEVATYRQHQGRASKIVLFLGRITFQKGPDYFVEAAARVIPHIPDVLFVMAGAGDMLARMVARVKDLKLEANFQFPGFLRGAEVDEMFSLADLYVMPSVSEPFGISALEAIKFETPVIISRQSGVSEVLRHALKVDFWDVDRMADLIINALLHHELRADLVSMAREEIKRLHWDSAAAKTLELYRGL